MPKALTNIDFAPSSNYAKPAFTISLAAALIAADVFFTAAMPAFAAGTTPIPTLTPLNTNIPTPISLVAETIPITIGSGATAVTVNVPIIRGGTGTANCTQQLSPSIHQLAVLSSLYSAVSAGISSVPIVGPAAAAFYGGASAGFDYTSATAQQAAVTSNLPSCTQDFNGTVTVSAGGSNITGYSVFNDDLAVRDRLFVGGEVLATSVFSFNDIRSLEAVIGTSLTDGIATLSNGNLVTTGNVVASGAILDNLSTVNAAISGTANIINLVTNNATIGIANIAIANVSTLNAGAINSTTINNTGLITTGSLTVTGTANIGALAITGTEPGIALGGGSLTGAGAGAVATTGDANAIAIGNAANATSSGDIAIGRLANASGSNSLAFGFVSNSTGSASIALGVLAQATNFSAVAIGESAIASATNTTAVGPNSNASGDFAVAVGRGSRASNSSAVALGNQANASGFRALAGGLQANASGGSSIALGVVSAATGSASIALGVLAQATNFSAVALGESAIASGTNTTALGPNSNASGDFAVAIGRGSKASDANAVSIGNQAIASGNGALAGGWQAIASGTSSLALGVLSASTGSSSIALGANSVASGNQSLALGVLAQATNTSSVALGNNAQATGENSVALGAGSIAGVANAGTPNMTINGRPIGVFAQASGVVSVGGGAGSTTPYRQITNVADGAISSSSTDAINGSQLYKSITGLSTQIQAAQQEARNGIAGALAITSASMPSSAGKTTWATNAATFQGSYAFGAAFAHRFDTDIKFAMTGGAAYSGSGTIMGRIGLMGEF